MRGVVTDVKPSADEKKIFIICKVDGSKAKNKAYFCDLEYEIGMNLNISFPSQQQYAQAYTQKHLLCLFIQFIELCAAVRKVSAVANSFFSGKYERQVTISNNRRFKSNMNYINQSFFFFLYDYLISSPPHSFCFWFSDYISFVCVLLSCISSVQITPLLSSIAVFPPLYSHFFLSFALCRPPFLPLSVSPSLHLAQGEAGSHVST